MSILLHKPYLVKLSTKGGGGVKNAQNSVHMVYGRPLSMKYDVELFLKNVVCYNLPYELVSFILMDDFKQILKFVLQENCRLCIN